MKPPVFPHMVAILVSTMASLSAQTIIGNPPAIQAKTDAMNGLSERGFSDNAPLPGSYAVPVVAKTPANLPEVTPTYVSQDAATLNRKTSSEQKVEAVVDLGVLRDPSPYQQVSANGKGAPYEVSANGLQTGLAMISAVYRESGKAERGTDCSTLALSVEQRVKMDVSKVLEVVEAEVTANASCACEIVKTTIKASAADVPQVVSIVETAINASPENMRIISQCAIAAMPESVAAVQALLAKLDPNSGDSDAYSGKSAKSAKSAKVAVIDEPILPNPLDLPPLYPQPPPPIIPPPVTDTDP